jgi:hypothetical protein
MNQPLHRIAYCAAVSRNVYIMLKRWVSHARNIRSYRFTAIDGSHTHTHTHTHTPAQHLHSLETVPTPPNDLMNNTCPWPHHIFVCPATTYLRTRPLPYTVSHTCPHTHPVVRRRPCRAGSGAKDGKYKCHGFVTASDNDAIELCKLLSRVTNEAFARLRHVTRLLEVTDRTPT